MTIVRPRFQPQNPAYSGCNLGWSSCTCFAGAMAAAFDRGVQYIMSGCSVRSKTHDTSGGTTLAQVDQALVAGWGVNLDVRYRYSWTSFANQINAGKGAILQGWYGPIADSRFDAGRGFRGNHAVVVLPGWIVMDPLADGRATGVYRYHAEAYPQSLLKSFAGKLNIGGTTYRALGTGLVYAAFTRDKTAAWLVTVRPLAGHTTRKFTRHFVVAGKDVKREIHSTEGFQLPCSEPQSFPTAWGTRVSLVQVRKAGSSYDQWWLSSGYASEA